MDACRMCGAAIEWIVTGTGRRIPVDPPRVTIHVSRDGPVVVLLDDGARRSGFPPGDGQLLLDPEVVEGRLPHMSTCPPSAGWG